MIDRMKKLIFVTGLVILVAAAATPVYSQITNRIGPMISFTSGDVDETGIGVVAEFGVAQKVSIAPQFILYFPGNDYSFFELNVNANYYFFNQDVFELYGLGGLNFARAGYDGPAGNDSNSELGLNLGIGSNFQFGKNFVPFAEFRFTIGEYDQFALGLGVKFKLGK
jgi:outer membrane immunogenic protein